MIPALATALIVALIAGFFISKQARRARTAERRVANAEKALATKDDLLAKQADLLDATVETAALYRRDRDLARNGEIWERTLRFVAEAAADTYQTALRGYLTHQARLDLKHPDAPIGETRVIEVDAKDGRVVAPVVELAKKRTGGKR